MPANDCKEHVEKMLDFWKNKKKIKINFQKYNELEGEEPNEP